MARVRALAVLMFALCTLSSTVDAYIRPQGDENVNRFVKCLEQAGRFTTFLKYLKGSGFISVLGRYVHMQPVTILVANDRAFERLPLRVRSQLKGARVIRVIENHMLLHHLPGGYLHHCLPHSFFDTVAGKLIYKQKTALKNTLAFSTMRRSTPDTLAIVVNENVCHSSIPLIGVHEIDSLLLSSTFYKTRTH